MGKQEIKDKLKAHGYTVIAPSWFYGNPDDKSCIVYAYEKIGGTPYLFFINYGARYARSQMFSVHGIEHDINDVSYMFFKEAAAC